MTDIVNTGTTANDGTGDTLRAAFNLINSRFLQFEGNVQLNERFQGAFASNPTTRTLGGALQDGDWYYSTAVSKYKIYTGSTWVTAPDILAATLAATGGADLIGADDGSSGSIFTTAQEFINKIMSSTGSAIAGYIHTATGAVAQFVRTKLLRWVDVEDFGAVGDGTTDDSAAFNLAIASGARRISAHGTYRIGLNIIELAGDKVYNFEGASFNTASTTATLIRAGHVNNWTIKGSFKITGSGAGMSSGTAKALYVVGCAQWRIDNPIVSSVRGWGIYVLPGSGPSISARGQRGHILNPQILDCYIGMEFGTSAGAEYCTVTAPMIGGCVTGAIIPAGNVILQGGNIVDNIGDGGGGGGGLYITGGSNNAHGVINGVNINHNQPYNLVCRDVTNGESFADCHFYGNTAGTGQGAIWLDNCKGITFDGGHLDCWIYNDSGASSGMNYVRNMYCPGSYGDVNITTTGSGTSQISVVGCFGTGAYTSGVTINDGPSPVYVWTVRNAATTQSLSSGTATDLTFQGDIFDRRAAFDHTTGIFTVPSGQHGLYRVTANLVFEGTGLSATASYVELRRNGSTAAGLFCPTAYSTTLLSIPIAADVYLNASDTLKLRGTVTGTSPTFGSTAFPVGLSIERIA